jgi:hypothetical protein
MTATDGIEVGKKRGVTELVQVVVWQGCARKNELACLFPLST